MWSGSVARDGQVVADWCFADRYLAGTSSTAPFDRANFSLRVGDDEEVVEANRAVLERHMQASAMAWPRPVHSTLLVRVDDAADAGECDAIVTDRAGLALTAQAADCVPILGVAAERGFVFAGHMGWKGAAADYPGEIAARMEQMGLALTDFEFWLGPSICGNCYQVDLERQSAVGAVLPKAVTGAGLDLRKGLLDWLELSGALAQAVGPCNAESEDLFSYRRDGVCGRNAAAVVLR